MKAIALISILFISACGKVDIPSSADFETSKSLTPIKIDSGSSEHARIKAICKALGDKELTIQGLQGTSYSFSQGSKKCDQSVESALPDVTVTIQNQSGQFKFQEGQNNYYFPDVELRTSGIMTQICAELSDLESPLRPDPVNVIYFTTSNIDPGGCPNNSDQEICIAIEKAVVSHTAEGDKGKIHTREWLRFKTIQPRLGFWSYRKLSSIGGCLEGSHFSRSANLLP